MAAIVELDINIFIFCCSSYSYYLYLQYIVIANVYICTGEDFISLQLVSYPFVLFYKTIKYV